MSQQRIWKQMVLDINCMCEKLQQYVEDKIECENKQLKYEEHFKKEYLKDEKWMQEGMTWTSKWLQ